MYIKIFINKIKINISKMYVLDNREKLCFQKKWINTTKDIRINKNNLEINII